jgi:hypothetical protein
VGNSETTVFRFLNHIIYLPYEEHAVCSLLTHGLSDSLIEIASLNPKPCKSHSMCVIPNIVRVGAGYDGIVDAPLGDTVDNSGTLLVCDPLLAGAESSGMFGVGDEWTILVKHRPKTRPLVAEQFGHD